MARRNQACAAGGALLAFTWLAAPPHSPQSQIGSCVEVAPACEGGLAQLADPQRRAAQDRTLLRRLEQQTDDGMAAVDETEILSETLDVGDGGEEEERGGGGGGIARGEPRARGARLGRGGGRG